MSAIIPGNNWWFTPSLSRRSLMIFGIAIFRCVYPVDQQWRRWDNATRKRKESERVGEGETRTRMFAGHLSCGNRMQGQKEGSAVTWSEKIDGEGGGKGEKCVYVWEKERERRRVITGSRGSRGRWKTSDSACIAWASISSRSLERFGKSKKA